MTKTEEQCEQIDRMIGLTNKQHQARGLVLLIHANFKVCF